MRYAQAVSVVLMVAIITCAAAGEPRVFPGAVGFGVETPAGRGGRILRVTNLNPDGPNSLRAALEAEGARIVVFEVGGVIDLGKKSLAISNPFITVAGQTAPSPGITVIRGGISIVTHDVLIRHICVRPGDAGGPKRSGWEPDGIATSGAQAYNVVVDHCSVTWAVDENISASGPRTEGPEATSHRITFSNCIIAEGLNDASHAKGPHSKGSLIHDCAQDIAIIGNLYAHNAQRNPYFKAHTTGAIVNNLIYNPQRAAIQVGYVPSEWENAKFEPENCRLSVVGNVLIHGANTGPNLPLVAWQGDAYMRDNLAFNKDGEPAPLVSSDIVPLTTKPVWPEGLEPIPAADVIEHVIRHAGARPEDRDDIDARIMRDFENREGHLIDSQDDVGGYPSPSMTERKLEIPDADVDAWLNQLAAELE